MFRRLSHNLPQDPIIVPDLDKLGYFVNEDDQIRQKVNPDKKYQYKVNRSERVNDMYKEAINSKQATCQVCPRLMILACSRQIVMDRLSELGMQQLRLPLGVAETEKHIPILISKDIHEKKHVIVVFPERHIESGILSYRLMGEESINKGSIVEFVNAVLNVSDSKKDIEATELAKLSSLSLTDTPGIIIANPSELIWFRGWRIEKR